MRHLSYLIRLAVLPVLFAFGVLPAACYGADGLPANVNKPMLLGPEDQVSVSVSDYEEIPDKPFQVDSGGYLDLPTLGRLKVAGLTIPQAEAEIATLARRYVKNPTVTVSLVTVSSQPVSVFGAVNKPGVYQIAGPKTLIEVLSLAGGLRTDAGSVLRITRDSAYGSLNLPGKRVDLTNHYEIADVDLDDLVKAKIPAGNIMIEAHDVVAVPKADLIYVLGKVRRPGGFPITAHEKVSLLQGLALAEGMEAGAAPKNARILRDDGDGKDRVQIPVNIAKLLAGKTPDVSLKANDVLFIPSDAMKSIGIRAAEAALTVGTGLVIYGR